LLRNPHARGRQTLAISRYERAEKEREREREREGGGAGEGGGELLRNDKVTGRGTSRGVLRDTPTSEMCERGTGKKSGAFPALPESGESVKSDAGANSCRRKY